MMNEQLKDEVTCLQCNQIIKGKLYGTPIYNYKELHIPIQCNHCKTELVAIVKTIIEIERKQ